MSLLLAIESSCDETAAAILGPGQRVRSNVVASQIEVHARFGGVVPELASRSHLTAMQPVVSQALDEADVALGELDAIAVTSGPGLAGCLLVGVQAAKGLAWARGLPLVPVDHIAAHVHAVFLEDDRTDGRQPEYPYVALAVSGGHTSLCRVDAPGATETLGQTLDDAAGEAFDKVAKMMGLPYPGGVHIDRLAAEGDSEAVELPRPMLGRGLDFSFSGLKTAVRYAIERDRRLAETDQGRRDLAASFQRAIAEVLVAKSAAACREAGISRLVLAGGVACNSELRRRMSANKGLEVFLTPARYCTDNAAMIGGLAQELLARGEVVAGERLRGLDVYTTRRQA